MAHSLTKYHESVDRLERAFERERWHRRVQPLPVSFDTVQAHVFVCVCCGRRRRDEDRREPDSEVCVQCVQAAGFDE
jgi:hypothetical protein